MDHSEATGIQAVEKYLLGELESSEKELFEEHFFTCALCAAEVRTGAVFTDNLRSVARDGARPSLESPVAQPAGGWGARFRDWIRRPVLIPAFAAAAFGTIAVVETLVTIPGLKTELALYQNAQDLPEFALRAAARGEDGAITLHPNSRLFTVYFDITWKRQPEGYVCRIIDASNRQRTEVTVPERNGIETIHLLLDSSRLEPGRYTVAVRSNSSSPEELGRYEFNLPNLK